MSRWGYYRRRGIALVTGEIGAGKSTAIRAFTEQLETNQYDVAYIADPTIGIRGILAGRTDPLFSDDVIEDIYQQAKGIPRVINNLCYACLIDIYHTDKNIVDMPTLEKVLLQWDGIKNI